MLTPCTPYESEAVAATVKLVEFLLKYEPEAGVGEVRLTVGAAIS